MGVYGIGAVYTQLSLQERRKIENWWHAKVPVSEVARVLKRHKSMIFREIKRKFWTYDGKTTQRYLHFTVSSPLSP
ncbi:helix-turn-helix domain-containing protein [uncultured Marivita sp.]|uniref:helix-turn-helix domain-containing protein n=1 Tax=uncultured Marivita sp. TaxID=888080 RepID=UPI00343FC702